MSSNSVVSNDVQICELTVNEDSCNFLFKINNFSNLLKNYPQVIDSSEFNFVIRKNIKWFMRLHIQKEWIGIFLHNVSMNSKHLLVNFSFYLINKDNDQVNKKEFFYEFNKEKMTEKMNYGVKNFIEVKHILNNKEYLFPDDTLTIACSMVTGKNTLKTNRINFIKLGDNVEQQHEFFEQLYSKKIFSDITLKIGDKELKSHKCVLGIASKVFEKGLSKDNLVNTIIVDNISYQIMDEVLRFIYTRKIKNLQNIAKDLLYAADKYEIHTLKKICECSLCENITINNVIELAEIAKVNNAELLKDSVIDFISKNIKILGQKVEFKRLVESDLNLKDKLFWAIVNYQSLK